MQLRAEERRLRRTPTATGRTRFARSRRCCASSRTTARRGYGLAVNEAEPGVTAVAAAIRSGPDGGARRHGQHRGSQRRVSTKAACANSRRWSCSARPSCPACGRCDRRPCTKRAGQGRREGGMTRGGAMRDEPIAARLHRRRLHRRHRPREQPRARRHARVQTIGVPDGDARRRRRRRRGRAEVAHGARARGGRAVAGCAALAEGARRARRSTSSTARRSTARQPATSAR